MTRWRTRHRGDHAERGAAAVEFAIVLVVLLLVIFAIIDFGRLFFVDQSLKAASREGARAAAVGAAWGPQATTGTVKNVVTSSAAAAVGLSGGVTLSITGVSNDSPAVSLTSASDAATRLCDGTYATGANVSNTITVSVPFRWFTPVGIFSSGINSVDASTTMRCE